MTERVWLAVRLAAVPALLVVVALVTAVRFERVDQSSWVGGGFGMFATYDNETTRWVRARDAGTGEALAIPPELGRAAQRLRVAPTGERARDLARRLRDRHPGAPVVRLEVWSLHFDDRGPTVEPRLLRRVTVPAGDAP